MNVGCDGSCAIVLFEFSGVFGSGGNFREGICMVFNGFLRNHILGIFGTSLIKALSSKLPRLLD
jgi:hypothetical protein